MPDLTCLACPGPDVEQHHAPRRSAGTEFRMGDVSMVIPLDDPRRLISVCRKLHEAIGEHRITLEHYVGGLLFTLDGVIEAKGRPDADYLVYQEQIVWQHLVGPDNLEEIMGGIMHGAEASIEGWEMLIPYLGPEELTLGWEHLDGLTDVHIQKIRILKAHQAVRTCFGFRPDGKPYTQTDKVRAVGKRWGKSERQMWRYLEEKTDTHVSECEGETSPDGRHTWTPCECERKCQHCGAKR